MPPPRTARPRARLGLEFLEDRTTPAFLTGAELVAGSDAGGPPLVRLIDPATGNVNSQFLAFPGNFYGGVRVAVGDVTGDGVNDLVAAAGPSGGPQVTAYDGLTGGVVTSFLAYPSAFSGGVFVAVGDVNGDGRGDIITGAGAGGGPQVSVFDALSRQLLASFSAYAQDFLGGVRVAAGDLNGDGEAEVVTAPGFGGGPDVRAFSVDTATNSIVKVAGYYAMDPNFYGGLFVSVGDVTGDSTPEIVIGAGPTGGPRVDVFTATGVPLTSFYAYGPTFNGGVRVATADLTGDGVDEIVTGAGPTGGAQVNVYSLSGGGVTSLTTLFALPMSQMTGVFVDGSPTLLNVAETPAGEVAASYAGLRALNQSATAINTNYGVFPGAFWGWGPFLPFGFYDGVGLFVGLNSFYDPGFFGSPYYYGDPTFIPDAGFYEFGLAPTYFDEFGYPYGPDYFDPNVLPPWDYLPGYSDFDYLPGYSDPGFSDFGGYDFVDPGYADFGGYDFGGYDFGGFDYGGFF
jgi:hypothetical protein